MKRETQRGGKPVWGCTAAMSSNSKFPVLSAVRPWGDLTAGKRPNGWMVTQVGEWVDREFNHRGVIKSWDSESRALLLSWANHLTS